jgi:hypothetical protein
MRDRLRKAQRLLAIQRAHDRLTEWTCAALESEAARLQERRLELFEVLDHDTLPVAIAPNFIMRHLQILAERHAALVAEKEGTAERWRQERARLRAVEQIVEMRQTEVARADDATQLNEAIQAEVDRRSVRQGQG